MSKRYPAQRDQGMEHRGTAEFPSTPKKSRRLTSSGANLASIKLRMRRSKFPLRLPTHIPRFMLHPPHKVHFCYQESDASQADLRYPVHLDNVLHAPTPCLAARLHCLANNTPRRVISENWVRSLNSPFSFRRSSSNTKHSVW